VKAVIVIDMPEKCIKCSYKSDCQDFENTETRPKTCPLRPLPEKRVYKDNYNRFSSQLAYEQGWNRVIEEITGEAEEIDARNKWWAEHSSRFD
jgi:hypothetical protein